MTRTDASTEGVAPAGSYAPLVNTHAGVRTGAYLLEMCTPRAGEVEILKALPEDARIGVGVVNQKTQEAEAVDEVSARIEHAIGLFGRDRLLLHCGEEGAWTIRGKSARPGLYQCHTCRRQFTITIATRTPFHAMKLDLRVWVAAMFIVITLKQGHILGRTRPVARRQPEDQLEDGTRDPRDDGHAGGVEAGKADRHSGSG